MPNVRSISPFRCRIWEYHDRLGEEVNTRTCASLIESMKMYGQRQPALGRPTHSDPGHELEIIYGARRLFAAIHLGIDLLVDVRPIDDRTALIEMDMENRVRQDISPYERGLSYKRWLRSGFFAKQSDLAKSIGISESQVSRLIRYADLPAAVVGAFANPRDIAEDWAVVLAKQASDPQVRDRLMRRGRRISADDRRRKPRQIFETLVADEPNGLGRSRDRDEVIRGQSGRPMMRVRYRDSAVHLILLREALTDESLKKIVEDVSQVLDSHSRRDHTIRRPLLQNMSEPAG